jgi:hypothetical protein
VPGYTGRLVYLLRAAFKNNKPHTLATAPPTTGDNEMSEELLPCQCGGEAVDRGHGIECRNCGIWLGNGTQAGRLGGHIKAWNTRTPPEHKYQKFADYCEENEWSYDKELSFNAARELKEK